MTIDVTVRADGAPLAPGWALNEATVEKAARERMIEVITEVDGRPLSRWGCDGVVCSTPTGSTAYAYSAGGPVVWPEVEALLIVPISAHALFAPPMVVSPHSVLAVELLAGEEASGAVLWCDGRRKVDLPPGARVEIAGAPCRCCWRGCGNGPGRVHRPAGAKFGLPVTGWQGRTGRTLASMLEEVRINSPGVIDDAVLELSAGFTALTGETGAGKTMVVTALGLLFGGRADPRGCGPGGAGRGGGAAAARRKWPAKSRRPGETSTGGTVLMLSRSVSAEGRSRRAGGRSVPVSLLQVLADDLVAVHGQADQQQLLRPARQREALDRFGGPELAALLSGYRRVFARHQAVRAELDALTRAERERAAKAEALRLGAAEIEAAAPVAGEDAALLAEDERLANADALHAAAAGAHEALAVTRPLPPSMPRTRSPGSGWRRAVDPGRCHDPVLDGGPAVRGREPASDVAEDLAGLHGGAGLDPARLTAVQEPGRAGQAGPRLRRRWRTSMTKSADRRSRGWRLAKTVGRGGLAFIAVSGGTPAFAASMLAITLAGDLRFGR